jgi:hypothetical protein
MVEAYLTPHYVPGYSKIRKDIKALYIGADYWDTPASGCYHHSLV